MKALELKVHGIKCDVCDYRNDEVKFEEYEAWLNKPCPKCGHCLLTQADLDVTRMLMGLTQIINEEIPQPMENEEKITVSVEMNGTGDLNFRKDNMSFKIKNKNHRNRR